MKTETAIPAKSKRRGKVPPPTLPPEILNQIVGQLKQEFGQSDLSDTGPSNVENIVSTVVDRIEATIGKKVDENKEEAFKNTYAYFDQANDLFPLVIGGGKKGMQEMLKTSAGANETLKPISSGVAYVRSRELCYTGQAVNWAAETHVLGDVMYVLAAIGAVGGLIFLGKMAYNTWIA